ncbi:MAG: hypothetical protein DI546_20895 [Rhizobium sp.]|nr:MAG: hypothetical protein DI546_20895 [Rhizobium sp.]
MTALEEIKRALEDLSALVGIVSDETGALKMSDADEDSVGWNESGPLPMTFGHVRRAHVALSTLESLQRENEDKSRDLSACQEQAVKDGNEISSLKAWQAGAISCREAEQARIDEYKARAEAAEAEVKRLKTELVFAKPVYSRRQIEDRLKVLEAALKPFAEYMGDHFDKDNHGDPLPDDLGVGWIYLTHADFRRARTALASTGGEHAE